MQMLNGLSVSTNLKMTDLIFQEGRLSFDMLDTIRQTITVPIPFSPICRRRIGERQHVHSTRM